MRVLRSALVSFAVLVLKLPFKRILRSIVMKSPRSSYSTFVFRSVIGIVVLIALLATLTPLFARQDQDDFLVYPADSLPFGMTYGDWNAAWIQYGLSIPCKQ